MLAALIQKDGLRRLVSGNVARVATVAVADSAKPDAARVADWWQERAAIIEFDGGVNREHAEREAWARTLAKFELPAAYRLH